MRASDVSDAVLDLGFTESRACRALRDSIPVLRVLRDNIRWNFIMKLALGLVISALESYVDEKCG